MSYARFGRKTSDVYVYLSCQGHLECCACELGDQWAFENTDAIVAHLREHEAAGHLVPAYTFEELELDREQNDRYIATGDESALT